MDILDALNELKNNNLRDRVKKCKDCGRDFVLTTNEQLMMKIKNFKEPKRCIHGRDARKLKEMVGKNIELTELIDNNFKSLYRYEEKS